MKKIKTSVREIVEYAFLTGSISSGFVSKTVFTEGTAAHRLIQNSRGPEYQSEIRVQHTVKGKYGDIEINGRIDGICPGKNSIIVEEIKSTALPLEKVPESILPVHMAQCRLYAYIYCIDKAFRKIETSVTYCLRGSKKSSGTREKTVTETVTLEDLEAFFNKIVSPFISRIEKQQEWIEIRNDSLDKLEFPFDSFRKGQRELAVEVFRSIRDGLKTFIEAPTGTGKTIGVLYPAVKALSSGFGDRIFYLTAKGSTQKIAESAVEEMRKRGLRIRSVTITAKEKICINNEFRCDPRFCVYALDYYDKLKAAIEEMISRYESFSMDNIKSFSEEYNICPFEFSLDLSMISDIIICDYNYLFDPRVRLKRYFSGSRKDPVFLIDEAHNLIDRGRKMFSAELKKKDFLNLKRATKEKAPELSGKLALVNKAMLNLRKDHAGEIYSVEKDYPGILQPLIKDFINAAEKRLAKGKPESFNEELLQLYFDSMGFIKTLEIYGENFCTILTSVKSALIIKLFCMDPSVEFSSICKKGRVSIFFSATLSPRVYFTKLLGGDGDSVFHGSPSPFPAENFSLLINKNISTKYKRREFTLGSVINNIIAATEQKSGNYIVFLPSFKYMELVINGFRKARPELSIIRQKRGMNSDERIEFLEMFRRESSETLIAFAVMGGIFGEGIDLAGEDLSGAVIAGTGLPQINLENNILKEHFAEKGLNGFDYAYTLPGFNRVMQAAGRVIRTETDRGFVLLIDTRFSSPRYTELFPPHWEDPTWISGPEEIKKELAGFWSP